MLVQLLCWLLHCEYTSFHYFGGENTYILLIISNNKPQIFWWMVYQLCNPSRQKCEGEGGLGNFGLDLLIVVCMYCHSVTVCHPPLLSPCVSFASAHTLLSSSTYFPSGCGCQHTAQNSAWETQSKTGTDSPRCTDHSGGSEPLSADRSSCTSSLLCQFSGGL